MYYLLKIIHYQIIKNDNLHLFIFNETKISINQRSESYGNLIEAENIINYEVASKEVMTLILNGKIIY